MKYRNEVVKFYHTRWKSVRAKYLENHKDGMCERCGENPIEEVHHKIRLTEKNGHDPRISEAWSNLEGLCGKCHKEEHGKQKMRTDAEGHVAL